MCKLGTRGTGSLQGRKDQRAKVSTAHHMRGVSEDAHGHLGAGRFFNFLFAM